MGGKSGPKLWISWPKQSDLPIQISVLYFSQLYKHLDSNAVIYLYIYIYMDIRYTTFNKNNFLIFFQTTSASFTGRRGLRCWEGGGGGGDTDEPTH